ncbi:MAG: nucleoside triphosphate pyrophosphohydrolase, partial [Odoribacter sp.]|nr:nucleoside triphosphate pyrophosphohydrolase [Odoribacter sp.]
MENLEKKKEAFAELLEIIATLRVGCPWDRKQTMESLRSLSIEEVYELGDAILAGDMAEVKKELGDLLMHIVFYAQIGEERQLFDIRDVLNGICEKLKYRHPHIYGDVEVKSAEEVSQNWEQLKLKEKGRKHKVLEGVPTSLPALVKAFRIQDKARGVGFDWERKEEVWNKVKEEMGEFEAEVRRADGEKME